MTTLQWTLLSGKLEFVLWEEGNVKQFYNFLVFEVSCRWTYNLSASYNDSQKIYSVMVSLMWYHLYRIHFHNFGSFTSTKNCNFL